MEMQDPTVREMYKLYRKRLFTGTVPVNKKHLTGSVPLNKEQLTGAVPVNKKHITGTLRNRLFTKNNQHPQSTLSEALKVPEFCPEVEGNPETGGEPVVCVPVRCSLFTVTVPVRCSLFAGTVPVMCFLFTGIVPANNLFLKLYNNFRIYLLFKVIKKNN